MTSIERRMEEGEAGMSRASFAHSTSPTATEFSSVGTCVEKEQHPATGTSSVWPKKEERCNTNPFKRQEQASGWSLWKRIISRDVGPPPDPMPINVRQLNDMPRGYPSLAAFLDSDESYMIYRRFGYLQSRLLLTKQAELCDLEDRLDKLEKKVAKKEPSRLNTYLCQGKDAAAREELMESIEEAFLSYSQVLTAAQKMMTFIRPATSDYQSLRRHMNNRKPLAKRDAEWITHKEDLITIRAGREHAWLDDVVEGLIRICHCRFIEWIFCSDETRRKTAPPSGDNADPAYLEETCEVYYTPSRIAMLVNGLLTLLVLVLLIIPIYMLYRISNDTVNQQSDLLSIAVMLLFTLTFSATLSLFTKAKRHEILASAAAYCAVLVVFLGNIQRPDP